MRNYIKKLDGVCPKEVNYSISDEDTVHNINFTGGCPGNLEAISRLCEGKSREELFDMLNGVTCGSRDTSCTAQLVQAFELN